jgi:hypothetical protein
MFRNLQMLTVPTAISIAFFDATFLLIAHYYRFSGRDILLGVAAAAVGGTYVLVAMLWRMRRRAEVLADAIVTE